jgi:hypothetical protein
VIPIENKNARILFESELGKRISDNTWYKIKRIFNSDFPMTENNIRFLALTKKMLPNFDLCRLDVISAIKEVNRLLKNQKSQATGKEIKELFERYEIRPHRNTYTKWFKSLGGFKQTRTYTMSQFTPVLLAGFAWKLNHITTEELYLK